MNHALGVKIQTAMVMMCSLHFEDCKLFILRAHYNEWNCFCL